MKDQDRMRKGLSRRRFIRLGVAFGVGATARPFSATDNGDFTFGVFADPQYADKAPAMGRSYRDSLEKLGRCIARLNELKPAFAIGLGDFTDSGPDRKTELIYVQRIETIYRKFRGERYYVIGNHDLDHMTKAEFIASTGMREPHYSFDCGPNHFVVLDGNFRKDFKPVGAGNAVWTDTWIPPAQQKWLAADLAKTDRPTIAFVHQRLDEDGTAHAVKNAADVRGILEKSGRVVAVFQGHDHRGGYRIVNGIHYVTLRGMVEGAGLENNAYATVTLSKGGQIEVRGFGQQKTLLLLQDSPATSATSDAGGGPVSPDRP